MKRAVGVAVVAVVIAVGLGSRWVKRAPGEAAPAVGCGGPMEPLPSSIGRVSLADPVQGATVVLQDEAGKVLLEAPRRTAETGHFSFEVPPTLPRSFRVVITGGTHRGQPFNDTLLLDVQDYSVLQTALAVDAVTTLRSLHRQRHPGMTLVQARLAAREMIGQGRHFSQRAFFDAFQRSGVASLHSWLESLSSDFDATGATRRFEEKPNALLTGTSAKDLVEGAFKFLLHEAGAEMFGWLFETVLTLAGQGGQAELERKLDEIIEGVHTIEDKIDALSDQIDLSSTLPTLRTHMGAIVETTHTLFLRQLACIEKTPECDPGTIRAQLQTIVKPTPDSDGFEYRLAQIHIALTQNIGPSKGAIEAYARYEFSKHLHFVTQGEELREFMHSMDTTQLIGTKVLYDARRALPNDDGGVPPPLVLDGGLPDGGDLINEDAVRRSIDFTLLLERQPAQWKIFNENPAVTHKRSKPGTVIHKKTGLITMQAPFSNLDPTWADPVLINVHPPYYKYTMAQAASRACESLNRQKFAGLSEWRLPSDGEINELTHGSPTKESVEGGVYAWLEREGGFVYLRDAKPSFAPGTPQVWGFVVDQTAYLSRDPFWNGLAAHAMWNVGNTFACVTLEANAVPDGDKKRPDLDSLHVACDQHLPKSFGAWCVHEGPPLSAE